MEKGRSINSGTKVAVAVLAGFGLGAAVVEGLHAQAKAKPPVYYIAEINVTNVDGYTKDYAPKAQAVIKKHGGKVLAAGQNVKSLEGAPPAKRVAILQWENNDKLMAWWNSAERKEVRKIADKYGANFRLFTIEGPSQ